MSLAAAHDARQDRLLERADRTADAAEAVVRKVWLGLLAAIQAGGHWHQVHAAARAALRSLPGVAFAVGEDLAAVAQDSARWTAETLARHLPRAHRVELARRKSPTIIPNPKPLLEAREPDPAENVLVGMLLPAISRDEVLRVLYATGWIERIQALTSLAAPDALAARIATLVQGGASITTIAAEIRPQVQGVQSAARRVARTAGLWIAHEAELHTYDQLGDMIEGYQIHAVRDHATRPEHRKRDGTKYYRVPKAGRKGMSEMPHPPREADGSWAFNCLLPETVVQGVFDLALKSRYAGKVVEIGTLAGRTLRVTPNHPVCTAAGFLPAGQIREGDHLIGYGGEVGRWLMARDHDEQEPPVRVDQLFRAAEQLRPARTERGSAFDFHGDAAFGDGHIEIVALGRVLGDGGDAAASERVDQLALVPADVSLVRGPRRGAPGLHLRGIDLAPASLVRGRDLSAPRPLAHPRPLRPLRVGPAANLDAGRHEYPVQARGGLAGVGGMAPTDPEFARELLCRFAGVVSADHVVEVRQYDWSGHVYDLQSPRGWIIANDLLVSNCRCFLSPIIAGA